MIRFAEPADAAQILDIYAPFIRDTSLTFETEVPSLEEFRHRIEVYTRQYPWLVFEKDGIIGGYAYASKHRERTGYQWCTECSIYLVHESQGTGIGKALYEALFALLRQQGYRNVYAVINLPNERSVSFHEKCGFKWFATYENVGYKLGRWKTVGWWILQVNNYDPEPSAPVSVKRVDPSISDRILSDAGKKIKRGS